MAIIFEQPKPRKNVRNGNVSFRLDLNVSFFEKDQVKRLGGRWDPALKTWYVIIDATKSVLTFKKWLKSPLIDQ